MEVQVLSLAPGPGDQWVLSGVLYLPDEPGSLAKASELMARYRANIERFVYNRSRHPNSVRVAMSVQGGAAAGALADALRARAYLEPLRSEREEVRISDPSSVLSIQVRLENQPGTLTSFASVLRDHRANVIFMSYDSARNPYLAEVSLATEDPQEVALLLSDLNSHGYVYHVEYRGSDQVSIDNILGLNLIENFFLKLRLTLPTQHMNELREVLASSAELKAALLEFRRQAGENEQSTAVSEVFSNILHLATMSATKTGENFSLKVTGPLPLTASVSLYTLQCPSGGIAFLFRHGEELTLVDTGYGLYYQDVKAWLGGHGLEPARIRRAFIGHPDADHAGWAGYLEEDVRTKIYMHPGSGDVFQHQNRAYGADTPLYSLNGCFTRLVNYFSQLKPPQQINPFDPADGEVGGFPVTGRFSIGDLDFLVLESLGGHVAAQVFFLNQSEGLLFCGDYLLDPESLSEREKANLGVPKFLMISTNRRSEVFREEMEMLKAIALSLNKALAPKGKSTRVFPGHGDFYRVQGW